MHDSSRTQVVGGYRLGRRVGEARFLGHALAPALVEIVFLDELTAAEQRTVGAQANDFSSLPDGSRVAILPRAGVPSAGEPVTHEAPLRLATPPDLRESWRHMEQATALAAEGATPADDSAQSLLTRVTGILTRARRGPVILAVLVGIVAILAVVLLTPSNEQPGVASSSSEVVGLPVASPTIPAPTATAGMSSDATATAQPLTPSTTLGDFVLVHVPARDGAGSQEVAVLERAGDTWVVRETYPESVTKGNGAG